jgi:ATP-dependent helicase HrpA
MNIRVVDPQGGTLAAGRDLGEVRRQAGQEASSIVRDDPQWTRDGLTTWDFGDLPERVEIRRGATTLGAFPALVDQRKSVSLRLSDSADWAAQETYRGLRRLFCLAAQQELKKQVDWLPNLEQSARQVSSLMKAADLRQQAAELIADRAFLATGELPHTAEAFRRQLSAGRAHVAAAVQQVANLIGPLCDGYHRLRLALSKISFESWKYAAGDVAEQLAHLTNDRFLAMTPWNWLAHYPRYFRAAQLRLDKLGGGGQSRDQQRHAEFQPRWRAYLERAAQHRQQRVLDPALEEYRWMLEEYRVAVFAQELGTAVQVSAKRLDKQWALVAS